MNRSGPYYFTSLKTRVFKCTWAVTRKPQFSRGSAVGAHLDPLSDYKSWCDLDGTHFWGLDLSPALRSAKA